MNTHLFRNVRRLAICAAVILATSASARSAPFAGKGLRAAQLRCEHLEQPLGIQETAPHLSWIVESGERGQRQTAWRVIAASSAARLAQEQADLWDSGVVAGDQTLGIVYQGKPLASHQLCHWKVKVWDQAGKESPWSAAARWSMGLLKAEDWKGDWIGCDSARLRPAAGPFEQAKWIWHAADPPLDAPPGKRLLMTSFEVPPGFNVATARLLATADDGLIFMVNSARVFSSEPRGNSWKTVRSAEVAAHLRAGRNFLRVLVENQNGAAGLIAQLLLTSTEGRSLMVVSDASWSSTAAPGADWGQSRGEGFATVRVLGNYRMGPWGDLGLTEKFLPPAVWLRGDFQAEKPVARATLYVAALGIADAYLNGRRVSEDFFTPGWTDYSKRVHYRAYEVTEQIRLGANAMGAVLADGWFSGYVGYRGARDLYGKHTRARLQLHLEYQDGTTADVASGPRWRARTGPTLEADFLAGEVYDARRELPGWSTPQCDLEGWIPVDTGSLEVQPVLQAHPAPAVRVIQEFRARTITEVSPGVFVLDLGQNFAGVPRLKVRGESGQRITLRFAERLNPDGTIYTTNLRAARATDTYICRGGGVEVWEPRFTFHGFQYLEISGLKQKPVADTVVGLALSSDTPVAGSFACSDAMLNRLHQNIYWTQRANFIDIPTDCPQRDERLGWTGDAQVYVRTATLNNDVQAFFHKWLIDLDEDGQRADGQFPKVAPLKVAEDDGGPAWADAGVICPWTIYSVYEDRRILERHYGAMTRFIEFCRARSTPDLLPPARYHCYGDWLSINANTPKEVIYTAYFAYSTWLTSQAAEVLGKTEDAARYRELFEKIRDSFNRAYVSPEGRVKGDTQCAYVLALAFDLVRGETARLAAQHLVEDIEKRGHLSTGFIGTKDLMLVLSKIGRTDVAYRLLHNDTFPSWGFSIKHGATSIWERWDGWTPEKGFQTPGMNSFSHYSFGAVYGWMVDNIGGILRAAPGYKEILIAPQPDGQLTWAAVAYDSARGRIATDWRHESGAFRLKVKIPANTTATLMMPARAAAEVTEGGKPLAKAAGVALAGQEGSRTVLKLGSGDYDFVSRGW